VQSLSPGKLGRVEGICRDVLGNEMVRRSIVVIRSFKGSVMVNFSHINGSFILLLSKK
jgi:hypothetical protein